MIQALYLDGSTWHLLKHGKIKLACKSLDEAFVRFSEHSCFVSRCGPWALLEAVIEAVVRAWSSVSSTWSAASQRLVMQVPNEVLPKCRTKCFLHMNSHRCASVNDMNFTHAPPPLIVSRCCLAPLCWLWPWKSRPNSWARRSSNCRRGIDDDGKHLKINLYSENLNQLQSK